ncbi:hypothetical protein JG687_00000416 [Phytophthora cactorum]|uniref:Uncharacterized protein n=1 Tax=Phytophthora cactorum TaxID=29920 RepID=A0A8T1V0N0_9STRA|nr:hypothetical protein PC117_g23649 [Phytophthora cactorum]KAG3031797.1 hypothetical protein PC120_g2890 [Phytophthora cactorum]KAG3038249.1 hypothetical protein PC119_g2973 [Phytophthora cactorum]KAG3103628.1 hypothetical protein PC121_g927 [Phytophthora cactorum]KAG3201911.1 hypothetical protein PC128_g3622 [Phytophthora cactorum]
MKFTNKDLYSLLFTELSPNQARSSACQTMFKSSNGYTNQVCHLLNRYPDYQELAVAAFCKGNRFGLTLPDQRVSDVFHWMEWCSMDQISASFCERPIVRKNAKMEPISAAMLQKYIDLLYTYVRDGVALSLPDKFELVLDESIQCLRRRFVLPASFPLGYEVA